MLWQKSQKLCSWRNGKARPICVSGRRTRSTFCARAFATGLDVVDEAERPIAPINVFSSIGVYELKFARGKTHQVELENLALAFLHLAAQADRNDQIKLTQTI
jgi:hypothetical protein